MKLCILDNDELDAEAMPIWGSYGAMFERLLREAGFVGDVAIFNAWQGQYPASFADYDAVLLAGSSADAFSDIPWVVELRAQVSALLAQRKKLIGVCFGHQLIAYCLGAKVARAPQGWGVGRTHYQWHASELFDDQAEQVTLLASHRDQVLSLPDGAQLLASNAHCPIAAYALGKQVFCIQPHPEFDPDYSAFLLERRRALHEESRYLALMQDLPGTHDGLRIAELMVRFMHDGVKTVV